METRVSNASSTGYAFRACEPCRAKKGKCDRMLPTCTTCLSKGCECEYSKATRQRKKRTYIAKDSDQQTTLSASTSYGNPGEGRPRLHAIFFLDNVVFNTLNLDTSLPQIPIPTDVTAILGDKIQIRGIASEYFRSMHQALPIVSRKRFYTQHLNPLSQPRADVALLVLCMKVIIWHPSDSNSDPQSDLYQTAKRFHFQLQNAGGPSIQVLQAGVIIALYELGHGIFPATYLTIGACTRYGSAFGFDGKAAKNTTNPRNWMDKEETKRTWWAIVILDHLVTVGDPKRALTVKEPDINNILPMDNTAWDEGFQEPDVVHKLDAPPGLNMSRFARLVQAAYLLGRVLRNVTDETLAYDFRRQEAAQLYRTLSALVNVSDVEGTIQDLSFCPQLAICYCALFALHKYHKSVVEELTSSKGKDPSPTLALTQAAVGICSGITLGTLDIDMISPLLFPYLYQSALVYRQAQDDTLVEGSHEAWKAVKEGLVILGRRWISAGVYADILEALEFIPSV
ncbi:hypothetical protein V8C35DRAFT_293427 [Trichoderma chlorosporum]